MIVREYIDMIAMTTTTPLANKPMFFHRPIIERSIYLGAPYGLGLCWLTSSKQPGPSLSLGMIFGPGDRKSFVQRKDERHLNELLHLAAAELRRKEAVVREHVANGAGEELVIRLHDLERLHVGAAGSVDDELGDDLPLDVRGAQLVRI